MDRNTVFSDYWELLNLSEDYLKGGYRTDHQPAPDFRFESAAPVGGSVEKRLPPEAAESVPEPGTLNGRILACRQCDLHMARNQAIPGSGPDSPRAVVVLPPPGYDEDDRNLPLTGEAWDFLAKWLSAVGLTRDQVYLTNGVKCRAPGTRPPFAGEIAACAPYLREQIDALSPEAVLILGETGLTALGAGTLRERRGKPFFKDNVFYLATYDPVTVMTHADLKRPAWEDLKVLRDFLNHG